MHLIIQFEFTKKIFKILRIQYNHILLLILLVFSFTNINYGLVDDWIGAFFGWAFFPIVFYYFVKIFIKKKINDYFKFSLFFSLWLINGHLGHITAYIIFLIYFIFSIKNFKELRNLFRLPFLISIVFIIFICSESIYFIARELLNFNGWRAVQGTYDIINYIEIFYPKEEFLSKFSLYRLPGNPILIYICIFFSSISLINFLKSIIQKNKNLVSLNTISFIFKKISSNYALKFNLLFLIFLVFSLLPFLLFIPAISVGGFLPRDIVLYVGIFVFFYNYKRIKKNLRSILILLMISYSIFPFIFNVTEKIRLNENNYILNKI